MSDQPFQPLLAADTVAVPISAPISETQLYQRQLHAFLVAADLTKYYQVLSENDLTVQLLKSCSTEDLKSLGLTLGSIKKLNAFLHPGTNTTKSNASLHPTLMQPSYGTRNGYTGTRNGVLPPSQQSNVDAMVVAGRINRKEHKQERCEAYCMGKVAAIFFGAVCLGIYFAANSNPSPSP